MAKYQSDSVFLTPIFDHYELNHFDFSEYFKIDNLGVLKYYLAPKISDEWTEDL